MSNIVAGVDLHQQVHVQFDLLQETLCMAIYLIDRSWNEIHLEKHLPKMQSIRYLYLSFE